MRYRKHLLCRAESVLVARTYTSEVLAELAPEMVDQIVLMVSELVTNVILHARTAADLVIDVDSERILVSVTDRGGGEPHLRSPSSLDARGRGLRIVDKLSDDWRSERSSEYTKVWFLTKVR